MTVSNSTSRTGNHDTEKDNLLHVAQGFLELQQTKPQAFPGPQH